MHNFAAIVFSTLLSLPPTSAVQYSPFLPPHDNPPTRLDDITNIKLLFGAFKRDSSTTCSGMGNSKVSCGDKAVCAVDGAGNVGCCPFNSVCTGTIAAGGAAPTNAPSAGSTAAAPAPAISHAISGTSTISNQYYPYPVLPTTYANTADCSTSFSSCQAESAKCTGFVEGGGYGVTVSGAGGGITQQAAMGPATAESICSSLSQQACHGLQLAQCSTLGGANPTATANSFVVGSSNAGATKGAVLYGMGVGMAVGLAGQMVG